MHGIEPGAVERPGQQGGKTVIQRSVDDHQGVRPAKRPIKLAGPAQQVAGRPTASGATRAARCLRHATASEHPNISGDRGRRQQDARDPGRCLGADLRFRHRVLAHRQAPCGQRVRPRGCFSIIRDPARYARASRGSRTIAARRIASRRGSTLLFSGVVPRKLKRDGVPSPSGRVPRSIAIPEGQAGRPAAVSTARRNVHFQRIVSFPWLARSRRA